MFDGAVGVPDAVTAKAIRLPDVILAVPVHELLVAVSDTATDAEESAASSRIVNV